MSKFTGQYSKERDIKLFKLHVASFKFQEVNIKNFVTYLYVICYHCKKWCQVKSGGGLCQVKNYVCKILQKYVWARKRSFLAHTHFCNMLQ